MWKLPAEAVDALNARLVDWRVGSRQPAVDRAAVEAFLRAAPSCPLHAPDPTDAWEPARIGGSESAQTWGVGASDWTAIRRPTRRPSDAAVIVLHGWLATALHVRFHEWHARPLLAHDVEVWSPRLPGHVERTPPGMVSGQSCLSANPATTAASMQLAVHETVRLMRWLRSNGRRRVGVWGTSLGGWVAALSATVAAEWDAVSLCVPVVDPVATMRDSPLVSALRRGLAEADLAPRIQEAAFAPFTPVRLRPSVSPRDIQLVASSFDNVTSRASVAVLESEWGVRAEWYPHGHISVLWSRAAHRSIVEFQRARLARA